MLPPASVKRSTLQRLAHGNPKDGVAEDGIADSNASVSDMPLLTFIWSNTTT
jgi:hypothetical protein